MKLTHAYFGQVVTNLTPNHVYTISGEMREDWWSSTDSHLDKYQVYIEAIGGQGTPNEEGRLSVLALAAGSSYPTYDWQTFTTQQTPDANGRIEVRLHYNKVGFVIYDKTWLMSGYFDDISLVP